MIMAGLMLVKIAVIIVFSSHWICKEAVLFNLDSVLLSGVETLQYMDNVTVHSAESKVHTDSLNWCGIEGHD